MKKFLILLLAPVILAGCSSVTNLTPSQYSRNTTGLYPIEAKWSTERRAVLTETMKPVVVIGSETYPMQPVPLVRDRWETVVPVSSDKTTVRYQLKFDYQINALGKPKTGSTVSPEYRLDVIDKK
jgi:uncharacterized protein YceK